MSETKKVARAKGAPAPAAKTTSKAVSAKSAPAKKDSKAVSGKAVAGKTSAKAPAKASAKASLSAPAKTSAKHLPAKGGRAASANRVTRVFTQNPKEMVNVDATEIREYLVYKLEQKFKMSLEQFCANGLSVEHFGIPGAMFRMHMVNQVNIATMQAVADKLKLGRIDRKWETVRMSKYTIK